MRRRELLAMPFAAASPRPNFVFILVDDLRFDELGCTGHPFAQTPSCDRLAREGAVFRNAFATTPLCSPSRACFLTGHYAGVHGIRDNTARDAESHRLITWPRMLHDSGYETAFIGKWHMGNDDSPRPGFDRWVSFRGQGTCFNPPLNVDGSARESGGYVTDILTGHAVDFVSQRRDKPFCLYLAHKAIHPDVQQANDGSINPATINDAEAFLPAPRHRDLYNGATIPRRANYGKMPKGQPSLETVVRSLDGMTPDLAILNRARMMKSVDEGLGGILDALQQAGKLDDTVVIFTSDHGYFYGEHGLGPERRLAYEEAIRIPLLVRYPRAFRPGSKPDRMVLSIDIAPTVLGLAAVKTRPKFPGQPLTNTHARESFLIEYFSDRVFPNVRGMGYKAIRTRRWKFIRYEERPDAQELYDLSTDPYEMNNLAQSRRSEIPEWNAKLDRLIRHARNGA